MDSEKHAPVIGCLRPARVAARGRKNSIHRGTASSESAGAGWVALRSTQPAPENAVMNHSSFHPSCLICAYRGQEYFFLEIRAAFPGNLR
jgi:hypothetical protein